MAGILGTILRGDEPKRLVEQLHAPRKALSTSRQAVHRRSRALHRGGSEALEAVLCHYVCPLQADRQPDHLPVLPAAKSLRYETVARLQP